MSKLKILITGAKGQLGKKIIEVMGDKHDLVLTDAEDMDITNPKIVDEVITREMPDFIIHGAAYTQVDKAEENEVICRKVNVEGTANVAKAAKANGATLIYISTDYVFDGTKNTPYTEDDQPKPLSVYGKTKWEGEKAVQQVYEGTVPKGGLSPDVAGYYIIRSAWIFGELPEGHPGTNFVETMLRLAKEKPSLSIVNDQVGSPTYTGDLVEVIGKMVSRQSSVVSRINNQAGDPRPTTNDPPYGIYHFSGTGECSWYDFACEIFKQSNIDIDIRPITGAEYPQKAKRPSYSYLDKTKIEQALGIKVRSWKKMLASYLNSKHQNTNYK